MKRKSIVIMPNAIPYLEREVTMAKEEHIREEFADTLGNEEARCGIYVEYRHFNGTEEVIRKVYGALLQVTSQNIIIGGCKREIIPISDIIEFQRLE